MECLNIGGLAEILQVSETSLVYHVFNEREYHAMQLRSLSMLYTIRQVPIIDIIFV